MGKKKGGSRNNKKKVGVVDGDPPAKASAASAAKASNGNNSRKSRHNHHKRGPTKQGSDLQLRQMIESDGNKTIVDMAADGNCLFRSISDQLYHDYGNQHEEVREEVVNFIEANKDDFTAFLVLSEEEEDEDAASFQHYIAKMKMPGEWGGQVELVAAGRLYRRTIWVYDLLSLAAYDIQHGSQKPSAGPDLLVSYHDNDHYNSVRDNTKGKPPLPIKTYLKGNSALDEHNNSTDDADTAMECEDIHTIEKQNENPTEESVLPNSAISGDPEPKPPGETNDEAMKQSSAVPKEKPLRKNDTCPCGSGLRYKRCCLARKKHNARLERIQGEKQQQENEEVTTIEKDAGEFRVLTV